MPKGDTNWENQSTSPKPRFEAEFEVERWRFTDTCLLVAVASWSLLFNLSGLWALEFFRHTEADRTLIAWEMLDTENFLLPHLLGSVILTKPPLFYWMLAASIDFFGTAAEWAVRMPSAILAAIFVAVQYFALRRVGISSRVSALGAMMLATSAQFVLLAAAAEIDMAFGFFCGLTLYAAFFATVDRSLLWTLALYTFAALAFLTKGPPIVFIVAAVHTTFFLFEFCLSEQIQKQERNFVRELGSFVACNVLGVLLFTLIVSLWLLALAGQVGWEELAKQFDVEVLQRITAEGSRKRGPFFYFGSIASGLLPWSLFLLTGALSFLMRGGSFLLRDVSQPKDSFGARQMSKENLFFAFNLIAVSLTMLMLSMAAGKSNRYIFPVHACALNLCLFGLLYTARTNGEGRTNGAGKTDVASWLIQFAKYLFAFLALAAIASIFFVELVGVSPASYAVAVTALAVSLALVSFAAWRKESAAVLIALLLTLGTARFAYNDIYVAHRNHRRSIKPVSLNIQEQLPANAKLYTIELFERWIVYYLKQMGRSTYRLTSAKVKELANSGEDVFVLINEPQEKWRLQQLAQSNLEPQIIQRYDQTRSQLLLVKVNPQSLSQLTLSESFPTAPSPIVLKNIK